MDNKKYFTICWFLFFISSWLLYLVVLLKKLSFFWLLLIIIYGLFLYSWRLYLNGVCSIKEINFKVILYYLIVYIHYVLFFTLIFILIFWFYKNKIQNYYIYIDDEQFFRHIKRWVLILSGIFISHDITALGFGLHLHSAFSNQIGTFTKKVNLTQIVLICTSILWWFVSGFFFISIFIITIALSSLPDFISDFQLKFMLKKYKLTPEMYKNNLQEQEKLEEAVIIRHKLFLEEWLQIKKENYIKWLFTRFANFLIIYLANILSCLIFGSGIAILDNIVTYYVTNRYNPFSIKV